MIGSAEVTKRKRGATALKVVLGLSAFAAILWYLVPTWDVVAAQIEVAPIMLVLAFTGTAFVHVVVALRWKLLSEVMGGTALSRWAYFHSLVLTRFLGQFAPALAMDLVGRGVALKSAGSERGLGHATTLIILERILDVAAPVMLLAWAIGVRQFRLEAHAGGLLALGTVAFVALATPLLRPMASAGMRIYGKLRHSDVGEIRIDVTTSLAFRIALLSVLRFAGVLLQFGAIGAGVGVVLPWVSWVAATPIAQITGMIGITPGGLGVLEAGWWGGLAWVGVERESIALFLLAQRAALVTFLACLTLLAWPFARQAARNRTEAE
jgi:uncharacterized membrane protein YbhN (UPF0104 family)